MYRFLTSSNYFSEIYHSWYILIVSLIVLPLSWNVIMGCTMIVVGPNSENLNSYKGFGFFSNTVYDDATGSFLGCVNYSEYWVGETNDSGFKLGRAFGSLLGASITFATLICLLVQCFNKHGKTCMWTFMKWAYLMAFLCQGGAFAIMSAKICNVFEGEASRCLLGSDGIAAIVNMVLLFGMVVATFNSTPPRNPVFRCWHAIEEIDESITDEEEEEDPENPDTTKSSRSKKRQSSDDSVSLFSSSNRSNRSLRSNAPRLTVREHAQRLEKKSIWPMNEFRLRALTPVNAESADKTAASKDQKKWQAPEDPRISTYYRNQRNIFKRFENKKTSDTVTAASSSSHEDSTIESSKKGGSTSKNSIDSIPDPTVPDFSERAAAPSPFEKPIQAPSSYKKHVRAPSPFEVPVRAPSPSRGQYETSEGEGGIDAASGSSYLRHIQKLQGALGISENDEEGSAEDVTSLKSGSAKSGSTKSGSIKSGGGLFSRSRSGSIKSGSARSGSIKSGSVRSDGSNRGSIRSGDVRNGILKDGSSNSSRKSTRSNDLNEGVGSVSSADHPLLDRLRKSVVLGKNGTRIEEARIGDTMKIVDEYPAPSADRKGKQDGRSISSSKSDRSGIVKVRTEYCPEGRKTVMEETFPDGSRIVTTLIDPMTLDDEN